MAYTNEESNHPGWLDQTDPIENVSAYTYRRLLARFKPLMQHVTDRMTHVVLRGEEIHLDGTYFGRVYLSDDGFVIDSHLSTFARILLPNEHVFTQEALEHALRTQIDLINDAARDPDRVLLGATLVRLEQFERSIHRRAMLATLSPKTLFSETYAAIERLHHADYELVSDYGQDRQDELPGLMTGALVTGDLVIGLITHPELVTTFTSRFDSITLQTDQHIVFVNRPLNHWFDQLDDWRRETQRLEREYVFQNARPSDTLLREMIRCADQLDAVTNGVPVNESGSIRERFEQDLYDRTVNRQRQFVQMTSPVTIG